VRSKTLFTFLGYVWNELNRAGRLVEPVTTFRRCGHTQVGQTANFMLNAHISAIESIKQAYSDPYLFPSSYLTVLIISSFCFHPVLQDGEMILDKNEKIWGGNLSLSLISGMLVFGYNSDDSALGDHSPLRHKERK
jgi:hypothetical protein